MTDVTDQDRLAEVERLRGLLRRLEWVPGAYEPSRARSCPVCWTVEGTPHDEERCWLAAAL